MTTPNEWRDLIAAARASGYQVDETDVQVILKKDGVTSAFARADNSRISGYMQCCIFLARAGIVRKEQSYGIVRKEK